jgi:WhiB family redox-sensing transcriptional regulator
MTWWDHAACQGVDPDAFFPPREEPRITKLRVAAAKAICAGCTVQTQCLEWAVAHERWGIWGNTTPTERRHIRIARRHARRLKAAS